MGSIFRALICLKLLVQRVSKASVEVENQIIASINEGVLVFVGFDKKDNSENIGALANKLLEYKLFNDSQNKIALSLNETMSNNILGSLSFRT